jgi:penicillin-binding protein 1C
MRPFRLQARLLVRACAGLGLGLLVLASILIVWSYRLSVPEALLEAEPPGTRVFDRHGQLLGRMRASGDAWYQPLTAAEVGPHTFAVLLAAEDKRFWSHPGVDPLAMTRAAFQAATQGHIVSGASTITQQLARTCFTRPKNLWGKLQEIALALRIERSLSKEQILLAYLNRVHFGPQIVGIAAASDRYFGKPVGALDLGETALLLATVRGPTVYDLDRHLRRAAQRRDTILRRAAEHGLISKDAVTLALATPAIQRPHLPWSGAWHWTKRLVAEHPLAGDITSTMDLRFERKVEEMTRQKHRLLASSGVSAVALVVLANERTEVLAYVGSQDAKAERELGQNDGAASRRQPGSALKPFLYAAAIDRLGLGAESLLPDEALTFRTATGHYTPENYDRRFRGPVSLSRALASSLNVPAVYVLDRMGVGPGLETLRAFGLASLDQTSQHYGLGLALGSGEVTLLELTAAYSALARGGRFRSPRLVQSSVTTDDVQVVSAHAAQVVTDILRDERARSEMFGPGGIVPYEDEPPFALKTGTSSGFRDAWAFVYDEDWTVGVWVGNFDGRPMVKTSGALGAAPLAVEVLLEARRARGGVESSDGAKASGTSPRTASSAIWAPVPRILFPAEGARLAPPDHDSPAEIVLRTKDAPRGAQLVVDGRVVSWAAGGNRERAVVRAGPGSHEACLLDGAGAELSSVTFEVVAPG